MVEASINFTTRHAKRKQYTLNIAIRGPHHSWSNTEHIINNFFSPAKFGDYLFICESGERIMAPSVNANLMTSKVFLLKKTGEGNDSRTHDEHSREEVGLAQIGEEIGSVSCRAIVISKTPLVLIRTSGDIRIASATTTSPPTAARVGGGSRIRRASTSDGSSDVWDSNTGLSDLLDPRLDFGRIRRRRPVKRRIVGRSQLGN